MDDLAAKCRRHCELATVDHGPSRSGSDGGGVTDGAADLVEQVVSGDSVRRRRQSGVAWRSLGSAHEAGKVVDIFKTVWTERIFGIGGGLADCGGIRWLQAAGYALLVDISVSSEGEQAGLLVLPAEASATHRSVGFRHRHLDELA